jgi:hypothetical protein
MPDTPRAVVGGVDTHKDQHVAAVVDTTGKVLDTAPFPADGQGYRQLLAWLGSFGTVVRVGVEAPAPTGQAWPACWPSTASRSSRSTGPTGNGAGGGAPPTRSTPRRRPGRCSRVRQPARQRPAAARSRSSGRCGWQGVQPQARTQAANQLHGLLAAAPEPVRARLRGLPLEDLVTAVARCPLGRLASPAAATKFALRVVARRYQQLTAEVAEPDEQLGALIVRAAGRAAGPAGGGHRRGRRAGGGRRGQPRPAPQPGELRHAVRCLAGRGVLEERPGGTG